MSCTCHISTNRPSFTRRINTPRHPTAWPVGGIPANGPRWGATGRPPHHDTVLVRQHVLNRLVEVRKSGEHGTEHLLDPSRPRRSGHDGVACLEVWGEQLVRDGEVAPVGDLIDEATGERLVGFD